MDSSISDNDINEIENIVENYEKIYIVNCLALW